MDNQEFDTSWFDLKKYDELSNLDLQSWYCQIRIRRMLEQLYQVDDFIEKCSSVIQRIKKAPVISIYPTELNFYEPKPLYPFNTHSVQSMTAHEARQIGTLSELDDVWQDCKNNHFWGKEAATPVDSFIRDRVDFISGNADRSTHLVVDLLTEYRKHTGIVPRKKAFTNKELSEWVIYRLLPYIDLTLLSKIEGKPITQVKKAELIFSNEKVDIVERVRKTTKPKAEQLFKPETIHAMKAQILSEKPQLIDIVFRGSNNAVAA